MKLSLNYGSRKISLNLPDRQVLGVYRPRQIKGVKNPDQAVRKSLASPLGSKRLRQIAGPHHKAAIVVDDITRGVPTSKLLSPVVEELNASGVQNRNICVLVATGLHRKLKPAEADELLGPFKGKLWITSHDPRKNLAFLGKTRLGTRVYLNRKFMEADVKILLGDVEFHPFCGFGGGAKSVYPGLADAESIRRSHSHMDEKDARAGRITRNPIREEIDEVGRLAGVDFIVNVVLNPRREIAGVFSGDVQKAFLAGARFCERIYCAEVPARTEVVIASAGGYPRDINLYQAQKAVKSALEIVKKGGKIILLAECREGHGSELFYRWMEEAGNIDEITARIKKKFVIGGHKAHQFARALKWAEIYLLSSFTPELTRKFFLRPLSGVNAIYDVIKEKDRIAVLPDATLTLPKLKPATRRRRERRHRSHKRKTPLK